MNKKELSKKLEKIPIYQGCYLCFPRALSEVAKVSAYGKNKHGFSFRDRGFTNPEYTIDGYYDCMLRHLSELEIEGEINHKDGNLLHRAQIAWNALAALEKKLEEEENEQV